MLLEGMFGTGGGSRVPLRPAGEDSVCLEGGRVIDCPTALVIASGLSVEGIDGGGYGDIEMLVTEALL